MSAQNMHANNPSDDAATRGEVKTDRLPSPDTKRWVARRKAEVVAAVRNGVLTLEEACRRYHLTVEEFQSWQAMIERHGVRGLRVTRIQQYRETGRNGDPRAVKASPSTAH